jgi:hypothetical protein
MILSRAIRGPFSSRLVDDLEPINTSADWKWKMRAEGYTSDVVDAHGLAMRLYRNDPNGVKAAAGAEQMNMVAAFTLMTDGTQAAYLRDHDEHAEDTIQAIMLDELRRAPRP